MTSVNGENVFKTTCFQCWCECGVLVHVKNGKVVRVKGDPKHPITHGFTCDKGRAIIEIEYHQDRLLYPLKRNGEKGEGKWKRISWNDALDTIATRLNRIKEKDGVESIFYCTGTRMIGVNFAFALGTPNWSECGALQCDWPRSTASMITFGRIINSWLASNEEYDRTNCIVSWAYGSLETWPPFGVKILKARNRGAKLIVIDPVRTKLAEKADVHLQVRPGTDLALALAMINVIVAENLYEKNFVRNWCHGFNMLAEHVKKYTPEWTSQITYIPAETIRKTAVTYALNKPASIFFGSGIEHGQRDSLQTCRAIFILEAITGNVDIPGGNVFYQSPGHRGWHYYTAIFNENTRGYIPTKVEMKRLGYGVYRWAAGPEAFFPIAPIGLVVNAMLTGTPYTIKAMLVFGDNFIGSYGNSKESIEALKKLNFLVVGEIFMTETGSLADIVLPTVTWLEHDELVDYPVPNGLTFRQRVINPPGECKSDEEIFHEIGKRMGFEDKYPWKTSKDICDFVLEPLNMTFEQFKEKGWIFIPMKYRKYKDDYFSTPSRKVEIYSSLLEKSGYDPLPTYIEPPETPLSSPALAKKYPLILCNIRTIIYWHSDLRQIISLREKFPKPIVLINPKTAEQFNVEDGALVKVESPREEVRVYAKITEAIQPGVIALYHGWPGEANNNLLSFNEPLDPAMGSARLESFLCRVTPLKA